MNRTILLLSLSLAQCASASERANKIYFYNATNKNIGYEENRILTQHALEPRVLIEILPVEEPKFYYWAEGKPNHGVLWGELFQEKFPEGFVIIFEEDESDIGASVRAVSKKQFDEEYAKAMKETQKKYTPAIQAGTPLPPPLCSIVSEYYVEKPEK